MWYKFFISEEFKKLRYLFSILFIFILILNVSVRFCCEEKIVENKYYKCIGLFLLNY